MDNLNENLNTDKRLCTSNILRLRLNYSYARKTTWAWIKEVRDLLRGPAAGSIIDDRSKSQEVTNHESKKMKLGSWEGTDRLGMMGCGKNNSYNLDLSK